MTLFLFDRRCYKIKMNLVLFCFFTIFFVCLNEVNAVYKVDVTCVMDAGQQPVCKTTPRLRRSSSSDINTLSHDPYIPRNKTILYNCSNSEALCLPVAFTSMIQLTPLNLSLKSCYSEITKIDDYACETIRYHHLKNIDKLLFLSKTIMDKTFYLVDCLVYSDGGRVCHRKDDDDDDSHAKLVHTATLVRPNETNVLSQDEFICEEDALKSVQCDLNAFVPYVDGLKKKSVLQFGDKVLLKTNSSLIEMKHGCLDNWCGYSGGVLPTRRQFTYVPPGGQMYRCFYLNKQQVCKEIAYPQEIYNERSWLEKPEI